MPDRTRELLELLGAPRPLSPAVRAGLAALLLDGAALTTAGTEADELTTALAALDEPRPLPPALRGRLEADLVMGRSGWLRHRRLLGMAAAAAAVLLGGSLLLTGQQPHGAPVAQPTPAPSAPSRVPSATGPTTGSGSGGLALGAPSFGPARPGASPAPEPQSLTAGGAAAAPPMAGGDTFAVTSVSPTEGPLQGGTRVVLSGSGLSHVVAVEVGGRPATSVRVLSDSSVSAVTPSYRAPGAVDVVAVLSSGARYGLSPAFRYLPVPTVRALDPPSGPMAGGNTVTVTGTGFTPTTSVRFDGTVVRDVVVISSTMLRVVAPAHLLGDVQVTVSTAGGSSATGSASSYRYTP